VCKAYLSKAGASALGFAGPVPVSIVPVVSDLDIGDTLHRRPPQGSSSRNAVSFRSRPESCSGIEIEGNPLEIRDDAIH
jgi:hypothetical protein